ncbi:MAG: prepilin-type N-terminal cleavage/methylation domain-containing protein [Planctomycetota bacterium]
MIAVKMTTGQETRARRGGFTLLELLLALALAVVVVAAISGAIRLYMGVVAKQQQRIETNQIARSIMTMMNNDIRAALQYKPDDYTGLENLAVSQELLAGVTAATGTEPAEGAIEEATGPDGQPAEAGDTSEEGSGSGSSSGTEQEAGEFEDPEEDIARPTFYGNQTSISVDISRLPRLDEYEPVTGEERNTIQLPSDVKSISFFVSSQLPPQDARQFIPIHQQDSGGLYRRQIDRAYASYRGETGIVANVDPYSKLIAPEVVAVQFRYFDGDRWLNQWDSEVEGGFPYAVEVWLAVDVTLATQRNNNQNGGQQQVNSMPTMNSENIRRFRSVIHLPTAEPGADEG